MDWRLWRRLASAANDSSTDLEPPPIRRSFFSPNLGSDPLGDLLEAPLLVELEGLAWALSGRDVDPLVKVGRGLQVLPGLLLQLLPELLPLHRTNVGCN